MSDELPAADDEAAADELEHPQEPYQSDVQSVMAGSADSMEEFNRLLWEVAKTVLILAVMLLAVAVVAGMWAAAKAALEMFGGLVILGGVFA